MFKNNFYEEQLRTAASDDSFLCGKRKFSFLQTSSQFLQSCFPLAKVTNSFLVSWNYGFQNLICSSKESFISWGSFHKKPIETYDRKIATGATQNNNQLPEENPTAACTFICLKIPEKSLELQPVSDEEIAGTFILTILATWLFYRLLENTLIF